MSVKNNTILIVEDDVTVSSALNEYLTAWDFEVVHIAQDGQNALEAYDATKPQFVIVDGHLGGAINCTELVSEIHKKGPVVILYSVNNVEDAFQNEQNYVYATGFIQKPINKFQLKLAIQSAKSSLAHWSTKVSKIEQDLNMANLQIEELTVTNEHLITATFRERALKKELAESQSLIEAQSKKIQDSINYAKSIQNSILPKEQVLNDLFSDSFMFFRPKDIVSGDFPFIYKKDEFVYFAAVDCTGHGVPGALLSLIGYLLIQEIVHYNVPTPSVLLDKLHDAVVKTLRQGVEGGENERDGMDVGMCRFNKNTGEFQFSGAHRPLYILRKGKSDEECLEELKGDKFPIGGVQYRGRDKFINFETTLSKGDRVFVCSDGYPDQFGGPDDTDLKKIGPKRIRQTLIEAKDQPISHVKEKLVHVFNEWQGKHKQMDDVLFLGIEF